MSDEIILVDIYDNIIGYDTKNNVHKEGKLHRAFSVFIFNEDKVLIQKRAKSKYHSGGLWSNSCCSHPRKGESIEAAAKRRLYEEVGIYSDIKEINSFVYYKKFRDDLFEYEYDHIFIGEYDGNEFKLDKDEVEEIKWVDIKKIEEDIVMNPNNYSVWFISSLAIVLAYRRNIKE